MHTHNHGAPHTHQQSGIDRKRSPHRRLGRSVLLVIALIILYASLAQASASDYSSAAKFRPGHEGRTGQLAPSTLPPNAKTPVLVVAGPNEGAVIVIVIAMIVIPFIIFTAANKRGIADAYSQLAKHFDGTFTPGGLFGNPQVNFSHADAQVIVNIFSTGGQHPTYYTQIQFYFKQPSIRCEVYPEKGWSRVKKLFGMQDIIIGAPFFDEVYIIQGEHPTAIANLLNPEVQQKIEQLRSLLGNNDIYVSFSRYKLQLKKRSYIKDSDTLLRYTQLAVGLYDQAMSPTAKGIEFVKETAPTKIAETVCQICGEPLETDIVHCRRCKTPHHRECWEYYGACSTYGCLERNYRN